MEKGKEVLCWFREDEEEKSSCIMKFFGHKQKNRQKIDKKTKTF